MTTATANQQLQNQVAQITAQLLGNANYPVPEPVRIHDPVWGTITLAPHEAAVLDTPLVQRLRRIKQLGGAHLVFPGAQHTRFEHTVGVIHQTERICKGLQQAKGSADLTDIDVTNLRMAALCHDLGHGPFSHSSESFFGSLAPLATILATNTGNGAAEYLSELIVTSAPMIEFFTALNDEYDVQLDASFIAAAIRGTLPPPQTYLGEIIHGPFDADKLDYLTRDGQYCGIPIRIDTERIFSSMTTVSLDENRTKRVRLAGLRNGAAALMQVVHHKHHMFAVVYHHDVARSFSAMLNNALQCAWEDKTPVGGMVLTSPADFLLLDDEQLLVMAQTGTSRADRLLHDLRDRKLFKVALEFDRSQLDEATRNQIANDSSSVRKKIAQRAQVGKELIAVDIAQRMCNKESGGMLLIKNNQPEPLGQHMDLADDSIPLHNFLERHLVLCPQENVAAVAAAAHEVLGGLVLPLKS